MVFLLLAGGVMNSVWATNVTYHILTLPIDNNIYHMKGEISGKRLEAFKITVNNQNTLELPAQYKSPLATGFTYYASTSVTKSATAVKLFDATNNPNKGYTYVVNGEDTPGDTSDDATPVAEGTTLSGSTAEYYVVYTYNTSNTIAKLDGTVKYNIKTIGYDNKGNKVEKGFIAYNRGRNNRPAVLPKSIVDPEMLASEDFMKVKVSDTKVVPYWKDGNNKNDEALTGSKFYFIFKFEGVDPYNIIVRTAYNKDTTYIEKNDNSNPAEFVYKYYKEGSLFAVGTANAYIASDEHRHYNYTYDSSLPENPTTLTEGVAGSHTGYDARTGYYHGQTGTAWNSFALLNNSRSTGYVFMGTRTVDGSGNTPATPNYLKEKESCNQLYFNNSNSTDNLSIEGIYPIKKVTFKVATPFYKVTASTDHIISVSDWVSQYTVENDPIETKYLPASLRRKYCSYTGKFYKDPACSQEITKFSDADFDNTEGFKVYVGYAVSASIPFQAITPAATYDAATWADATWYELTDEGSTQEYGRKLKYDGTNFKNNGAAGEYAKTSEFAFIGDPYELRVVYRNATSGATPYFVGAIGNPPTTGTLLTATTSATAGYLWELPTDDVSGSFLLQKYKGEGCWSWNAGQPTGSVTYQSNLAQAASKEAQTITFTVSGLNGSKYISVTTGGTDVAQIVSVTPTAGSVVAETGTSATVTVKLAANTSGADKTMTVTIQEYNDDKGTSANGTASVITITQGPSSSFAGNTVHYSTASSTHIKVMELPKRDFTYNIVDKEGNIAVKATANQTIFSPLSLTSIPGVIVSPFIADETITFYSTYSGGGRANLSSAITNLPEGDPESSTNVYVSYTTTHLGNKPIMLNETQEFNVKLNGEYLYYDTSSPCVKSNPTPSDDQLKSKAYLWKLRNRDPYAMLVDNLGAREVLPDVEHKVADQSETVIVYDDAGVGTSASRQKGAWIDVATIENAGALSFTTVRADAQRFIAKRSTASGVYEVMVATGTGTDASSNYYNIGRSANNVVQIYDKAHYAQGNDVLKFQLEQSIPYTYHLIDKAKHELLTLTSQNADLALPAEYQSPLVGTYSYYAQNNISVDDKSTSSTADDEYTVLNPSAKLGALVDLEVAYEGPSSSNAEEWGNASEGFKKTAADETAMFAQVRLLESTGWYYFQLGESGSYTYQKVNVTRGYRGRDIYVTYDVNDLIGFNNTGRVNDHPYLLRFLEPYAAGYYLEDGNDKLTTSLIQAVYPYCNGDGNLNIYGTAMRDEQMNGGSSTRPRWVWFFESANSDPYHVRIHSRSTISYNNVAYPTYLQTYAVHFKQSAENVQTVVTGGAMPGIASEEPTEYMILGIEDAYKLLTTKPIQVDLNGDGDIEDDGENERRKVTSFEQYWKTYNMAKLHVLGISSSTDAYSDNPTTWVVPTAPSSYRTALEGRGWHSYEVYASAVRWNGYNDKSDGHEKKLVEKVEHWFQTFSMGNGTFDVESADIPPVLVLLDQHGWEIMRKPLPVAHYPEGEEELAALRAYDSPLVKEYKFYSQATKATGCHKYTLRMQNGAERDQIKVNGVHYTSTSLADLPPANASGVKSSGVLNDQFVTYTVKEEYADNYAYNLDYTTTKEGDKVTDYTINTETGTSQPYLVLQNGRFYKVENEPSKPSYITKPIFEHSTVANGNAYDMVVSPRNNSVNIIDGSGNFIGNNFWYVKPNLNIDEEMGIKWGTAISGSEPLSEAATKVTYKDKSGFDPYNIQLQLMNKTDGTPDGRYLTTHMTSAKRINGVLVGNYTETDYYGAPGSTMITLEDKFDDYNPSTPKGSEGYDHTNLQISNQTFMAVSDENGNLQLMPRFDHTKRVNVPKNKISDALLWASTLEDPVNHAKASVENNNSMGPQTTFFVRPQRFIYHIIDNKGREALRYTRGGDNYPAITEHFKSPLATDFTYYKGLAVAGEPVESTPEAWAAATGDFKKTATTVTLMNSQINLLPTAGIYQYRVGTRGNFTYYSVVVSKGLSEQEITGSFAEASENNDLHEVENHIYVRYNYNEDADHDADRILKGQWFTVKLADKDLQAAGAIGFFQRTATGDDDYTTQKAALSIDGVYFFRIGTSTYTYNKVTVSNSGETKAEDTSSATEWTYSLDGTGVSLYAGGNSRSLIAADDTEYQTKRNALTAIGDYYFKIGESTYKKVSVTSVPIDDASDYTETIDDGTYEAAWSNSKPLVVDADGKKWQWKFMTAPADPSSDYFVLPDPYAVQVYNRDINYTINPSLEPSPMAVGIKVPNESTGVDRFALLSHPSGGYALVVAKTYTDNYYRFLNGASMTVPSTTAADTVTEVDFTYKTGIITDGAQLLVDDDVVYHYTYNVINNANKLAITAEQNNAEAAGHDFAPYLPESAQTPLLNMDDYKYYGFARPTGPNTYAEIPQTILYTLYGLYDDVVYVRYGDYDVDKTNYKIPNKKTIVDSHVARDPSSVDVSMNINGELPYNIIWYNDNMMSTATDDATTISDGGGQSLSGLKKNVWYIEGNDPYALKIRHKESSNYVNGTATLVAAAADAKEFMLLKMSGHDYGILQETAGTNKLSGYGQTMVSGDPTKFIIFGLSVHDLIYRLIIAKTCTKAEETDPDLDPSKYVNIPYRETKSGEETTKRIFGSTQRDLVSQVSGVPGDKYQLGTTLTWGGSSHTYCHDAGPVSIGDDLTVPNVFNRPNCTFEFYIAGIYDGSTGAELTGLESKYKGLKLNKLMSDADLIDETVVVNIVYSFNQELATNNGMDFVRSIEDKCWYTFETQDGTTPYLAHYTNAWGLQSMAGRETRYTNDYLWTPVGDVYGFKLYNRYMIKNSDGSDKVMTFTGTASEGKSLAVAKPGSSTTPPAEAGTYIGGNEVFELLTGDNPNSGYFRVHPVINNSGDQYYVWRDATDGSYTKLSTTPCDWTFGLSMDLMEPYHERAGYVGGLTANGKKDYETAVSSGTIMDIQHVVYDDANIIPFTKGYYRLHNQPGVSGISPVRYASGYLHDIEKTAGTSSTAIPMHFYSKAGVNTTFQGESGLESGFTLTDATRGEIPVPATEYDPSTIFYLNGSITNNPTISEATMSTQGLNVSGNKMTTETGTTFTLIDIGGATFLITDVLTPATRNYFNFDQTSNIYDLKFAHEVPTDDAKWCLQPVQKTGTVGNGEMPLNITANQGGDGYYYTTFYAPYDVLLPADGGGHTYNAYTCKTWHNEGVNPAPVPEKTIDDTTYAEGKFVPAGTPVIIRTNDESGSMKLTLPTTSPSPNPLSCVFTGSYLEGLLDVDAQHDVYVLGLPFTTTVTINRSTGDITAELPEQATSGVGFYINATSNKEHNPLQALWFRNNRYVLHNKIYYRATGVGGGAPDMRDVQFVPVLFDEGEEEEQPEETQPQPTRVGDGCVYDILGRKVASAEEVKAGTWYRHLSPGVYIVNGQKVFVGVGRM